MTALTPEAKRGRQWLLIASWLCLFPLSPFILIATVFYQSSVLSVCSWFIAAMLMYWVWCGRRWARWIVVGLLGFSVLVLMRPEELPPAGIIIALQFGASIALLAVPASVATFLKHQQEQYRNSNRRVSSGHEPDRPAQTDGVDQPPSRIKKSDILMGIFGTILFPFPLAMICGAVYRFPVPFAGYRSGGEAIGGALFGVLFYGLGDFVVLGCLGAVSAVLAWILTESRPQNTRRITLIFSFLCAALDVLLLSSWDKLTGHS